MSATTHRITIPYFPKGLNYAIPVLLYAAYELYTRGFIGWAVILLALCVIIPTTRYVTLVDSERKVCEDYLFFLSIPFNKEVKKFNAIDRVIITKGKYRQNINTRASSRELKWEDFTATLLFDDQTTVDLLTHTDPAKLIESVRVIASMLKVGIEDRTTREYRWL